MKFFLFLVFVYAAHGFAQERNSTVLLENEDPAPKLKKFIYARLEVNKKKVYVNEPLLITYKLYSALESNSILMEEPKFNQFSAYNITVNDTPVTEVINQVTYNVYEIKKLLLYSVSPGFFTLDKMKIKNEVLFKKLLPQKEIKDLNDLLTHPENYAGQYTVLQTSSVTETEPVPIEVVPLPPNQLGNTHAVGDFEISSFAENKEVPVNRPVVLQYRISGTGNFVMINDPNIPFPAGAEVLEPKIINSFVNGDISRKGFKLFTYSLLFKDTGSYKIPGWHFSFFNPSARAYKTIENDSITVRVVAGRLAETSPLPGVTPRPGSSYRQFITYGLFALLPVGGLLYFLIRKKRIHKKRMQAVPAETTETNTDAFINTKTNIALNNNNQALHSLRMELITAISRKNNLPGYLGYRQILEKIPATETYKESVMQIIQEIDKAIYAANETKSTAEALLARAIALTA